MGGWQYTSRIIIPVAMADRGCHGGKCRCRHLFVQIFSFREILAALLPMGVQSNCDAAQHRMLVRAL